MSRLPKLSGKEIVKILVEKFGFEVARQKGSHVVLRKFKNGEKIVTIVPMHREVKTGTLLGILNSFHIFRVFQCFLNIWLQVFSEG
jgi:predicted RNA binding protein YcfA (HicA-like mRNA interferase family)